MILSVLIPCYNEEKIILNSYQVLKSELEKLNNPYEIIFCNDGSLDGTLNELERIKEQDGNVKVVSYYPNKGAGYAFRQLCGNASGEVLIHMDADLAMEPKDTLALFLQEIEYADIVVGSRYDKIKAEFPLHRLLPSKLLLYLNKLLFRCPLKDTNSGFFAIKRKVISKAKLSSNDFQIYTELFIKAIKDKFTIKEIPIKFMHKKESGEANMFKHGPRIMRDIFILWLDFRRKADLNQ
jgi:glycosyltransferase involved in cell wall biosynthesis